jgi:hypothetical protein
VERIERADREGGCVDSIKMFVISFAEGYDRRYLVKDKKEIE